PLCLMYTKSHKCHPHREQRNPPKVRYLL
ncbi:hypothetical protein D039_3244B, partial [Vibrio parahaemolyticus EKP-028]